MGYTLPISPILGERGDDNPQRPQDPGGSEVSRRPGGKSPSRPDRGKRRYGYEHGDESDVQALPGGTRVSVRYEGTGPLVGAKIALKPDDTHLKRSQEIAEVAEELLDGESGQPKVVFAATILGNLVLSSQSKGAQGVSSSEGESPRATVTRVLAELGTEKEVIDQVCQIIEDRINGTSAEDSNHRIVSDALMVVDLLEKKTLLEEAAIQRLIENKIQTETGKRLARERLLSE